jgi:hypothetical protein
MGREWRRLVGLCARPRANRLVAAARLLFASTMTAIKTGAGELCNGQGKRGSVRVRDSVRSARGRQPTKGGEFAC